MRRIALLLQYDGTDFHGYQTQAELRTVQQTVETALETMLGRRVRLRGSSRTDSGVHARGLPAQFEADTNIPLHGFRRGLNSMLPHDVSVVAAADVGPDFDVRRSSRGKEYHYAIWNGPSRSALRARTSWFVPHTLDLEKMQRAADSLCGEHDFSAYRATGCQAATTLRRLTRIAVEGQAGEAIRIEVEGNAFLQHMVRIIVGTLVDVGRGYQPVGHPRAALEAGQREAAGPTAPARGLLLHRVVYEPPVFGSHPDAE